MNRVIIIPARLASERLPRKLLLTGTGRPLIQHTVERCQSVPGVDRVVVAADGRTIFPDPALGAVAGIGLAVIADAISATTPGELRAEDLSSAREVVAVNAVRGPRPIVRIDGAPVADGRPGPVARRLGAAFAAALQDDLRSAR